MTERLVRIACLMGLVCAGCAARGLPIVPGGDGAASAGSAPGGAGSAPGGSAAPRPRLVAPRSTATVASRRPRLRWDMSGVAGAAVVDLCRDRACQMPLGNATVEAAGSAARPDGDLPPGVVFWRVRAAGQTSATWELFVGHGSAPVDGSWGATLDLDGDGVPDAALDAAASGVALYLGGAAALGRPPTLLGNPDDAKAGFGYVIASAGDLDGDGYGDLAVGECGAGAGHVHVYFGGPGGPQPARTQTLAAPDLQSGFGCRLAAAGDLDGDGYADLAVGRIGADFSGGLFIFRGGPQGLPTTTARIDSPDYHPSRLGYSLAGVGDLDGDGYDDLVASEIDYSALSGRAHVYRGGPGGISNARVVTLLSPDPSGLQFGASVAGAGDVDGDGYADFVVAAPAVSTTKLPPTAHLYRGGPGSPGAGAPAIALSSDGTVGFGAEVEAAGDVDGDGFDDVIIASASTVTLFRGVAGGLAVTGTPVAAVGQGANPRHLAGAGDLDGDGHADLLVSDGAGVEALFGGAAGFDRARAGGLVAVQPPNGASVGGALARWQPQRASARRRGRSRS